MKHMRALVLEKQGPIEDSPLSLQNVPIPTPGHDEVLIKIEYCAVCRTDLHIIEGDLPLQAQPLIPGHQAVGTVVALGIHCDLLKIGMTVGVAWLGKTCESCEYCRAEKENLCLNPKFTGYHLQGGYAEYMTAKEKYVYVFSSIESKANTTPLLCAGIIGYRALKRSQWQPHLHLGIFGFGSSAHIVAQLVLAQNAQLSVVTRSQKHQEFAKNLGVHWAGTSAEHLPDLLDAAILFAPAGDLVPRALEKIKRGGTLAVAGIHLSSIPQLDYEKHLFYEKDLRSVTANTRQDGRELFILAEKFKIRSNISLYNLSDGNLALQNLKKDLINGTAVLSMN